MKRRDAATFMKVRILAIGSRMPAWVEEGCKEYRKRIPPPYTPELKELNAARRSSGKSVPQTIADEDERMLTAIRPAERVIALDQGGTAWSTEQLASAWSDWQQHGDDVCLLIGGPDGLGAKSLQRANQRWSLSALTLPHPLVRVLLFEQLYRAWTIQQGHPYHK